MIGKILANRYEILEKIGAGGMGDVYKAHDRKLDRIVAVKILKAEYTNDNNFIRKFKRESLAAASISHPNIVNIYDVGTEDTEIQKVHYIVMEFIDGKTLKEIINEENHLSERRSLNYTTQIAEALKMAHSKGIVHRDIKTQNIMVTGDDRVKVTDFGIARVADNSTVTATNAIMGSVHYFSPEQARGAKVDNRSDIYSLGIVLYEMLTGKLPFDAENPVSIALMQVQNNMPLPSASYSNISTQTDALVLKMTRKNPDDRYSDATELIKDIKNIQLGRTSNTASSFTQTSQRTTVMPNPEVNRSNNQNKKVIRRDDEDDYLKKPTKKKKKKGSAMPVVLGIVAAVLIVYLLFIVAPKVFQSSGDDETSTVTVPVVINMTRTEARARLEAVGLVLETSGNTEDTNYDDEEVIEQDPASGTEVEVGSTVKVVVNILPDAINMPNLVGSTLEEANGIAEENGIKIATYTEEFDDEVEIGKIISQDPVAGTRIALNKTITVVVSKGEEVKEEKQISNYVGQTERTAKSALEDAGFVVDVKEEYSNRVGVGEVIDYSPKGSAEEGSTITLIVNSGEPQTDDLEEDNDRENNNDIDRENNSNNSSLPSSVTLKLPDDDSHQVVIWRQTSNGARYKLYDYNKSTASSDVVNGYIIVDLEYIEYGDTFEFYVDGSLYKTDKY